MKKSFLTKGSHVLSYFLILLIITACGGESLPLHTAVSSITINQTQITLLINESTVLNATITPSDATNKNVSWSSSDVSVASVNQNGLVTAIKAGITTITVTTEDGNKTASCAVTVKERVYPVNGIS
ncbi:MAG: Ig domain-containing protein, partial [Bacteroidales bacterium]|nr:Ig domain-containing protein [Bacteroidales bacterium]